MRTGILTAILFLLTLAGAGAYVAIEYQWIPSLRDRPVIEAQTPPALTGEQKEADARKQLAFVSLVERLPKGRAIAPSQPLDAAAKKRWEVIDHHLATDQNQRVDVLKALHERTRKFFVESPGAGPFRPVLYTPEMLLLDTWHGIGDPKQPGQPPDFPASASEMLTRVQPSDEFHFYHEIGVRDFLYPYGFGYIKNREQVSGFKPHGFRHLGVPMHESKHWRVHHVLLVGILTQDHPVVYLTDKLPSMEQIRQDKVRSLDFFEEAAMPSLRRGDDLYIAGKGDTLRMLGALRATKTCQKCHDAEIGDLLGAFSYTLRPAPKVADHQP